jgi:hypothetical protein
MNRWVHISITMVMTNDHGVLYCDYYGHDQSGLYSQYYMCILASIAEHCNG